MRQRQTTFCMGALLLILLLVVACEGPQGPQGLGADDLDFEPPEVTLITPQPYETVSGDTFTVEAKAQDNRSIRRVEFYVDGRLALGGDSIAVDSFPRSGNRYSALWTLTGAGIPHGYHTLVVRALDDALNQAETPPMPFLTVEALPFDTLYYDDVPGAVFATMTLPDRYGDRYVNVRFTPLQPCRLEQVMFQFWEFSDDTLVDGIDIRVFAWTSQNHLPDELVDSVDVPQTSILTNEWMAVDVRNRDIRFDSTFHAGFSPPTELYSQYLAADRGVQIGISWDQLPGGNPSEFRSSEYEHNGRGWGTMYQQWEYKYHLRIRAVVAYGDGGTAMLFPGGGSIPLPADWDAAQPSSAHPVKQKTGIRVRE